MADNKKQENAKDRGGYQEDQSQSGIDPEGCNHGSQHHHRRTESGPHAGGDGVLDGSDIAGKSGYQGRFAETVGIGKGKLLELCKFRLSDFSAQPLAAPGCKGSSALAQDQGEQCQNDHLEAAHQNVVPVSVCHAYIHDGGHDQRDNQLKHGFRLDAEDSQNGISPVRL